MHKTLLSAALLLSSLSFASTWEIDTAHATAGFTVKHLMVSNVTGRLGEITGKVELDDKDITKSVVEATIDVTKLDTNVAKRDEHLRSPDFFDVAKFPSITFKSTKVEKNGERLKVTGDLTMHGVTKPVTLDVEVSPEVKHPMMPAMVRAATATGVLNREDFGLKWNKAMANNGVVVGKEVKLALEIELVKKDAMAPPPPAKKDAAPKK